MTVLSPLPDDQRTRPHQRTTSGRSPTTSTPAQYRKVFHRYQLRTKKHMSKYIFWHVQTVRKKPHQKITLLTALKAQKKPATKKHVSRHIKKPQKTSIYSRSPCSVGIESVNFYHVLKCAFFGDKSARKNHTIKDSLPDIIPVKYISS